ncbi:Uncharacterized protein Adt_33746 [Abeliophyllum distichum]|uniref:Uncharacterized protein n=1 Tax=Abeliophyllum distichum TaxID=126358 RepID=A0ABD1QX52_9LAMI
MQCLHDIRQARFVPLQSYLSQFNEEILFYERISDAEAISALKRRLDMNLPFWRDVQNNNPTTFDQLVELITEEITNKNMILHRNCGGWQLAKPLGSDMEEARIGTLLCHISIGEVILRILTLE